MMMTHDLIVRVICFFSFFYLISDAPRIPGPLSPTSWPSGLPRNPPCPALRPCLGAMKHVVFFHGKRLEKKGNYGENTGMEEHVAFNQNLSKELELSGHRRGFFQHHSCCNDVQTGFKTANMKCSGSKMVMLRHVSNRTCTQAEP